MDSDATSAEHRPGIKRKSFWYVKLQLSPCNYIPCDCVQDDLSILYISLCNRRLRYSLTCIYTGYAGWPSRRVLP